MTDTNPCLVFYATGLNSEHTRLLSARFRAFGVRVQRKGNFLTLHCTERVLARSLSFLANDAPVVTLRRA